MANVKISGLTAYTDPVATDVLPIVDLVNDQTKKVKVEDLLKKFGLGTEALPSFAFTGDLDTGIYSPGANQFAVTTGGTQRLLIDASGNTTIQGDLTVNGTTTTVSSNTLSIKDKNIEIAVVSTPTDTTADGGGITLKGATDKTLTWVNSTDCWTFNQALNLTAGTAGAPALVFNGDVNSGLFQPGADSLAIATGGAQRVTVDSSGRLLVGTTTEGYPDASNLTVAPSSGNGGVTIRTGTSAVGSLAFSDGTSGADEYRGLIQYRHGTNNLGIYTDAVERIRIDSSGNVGIGASTFPANGTNLKTSDSTITRHILEKTGSDARTFEIGNGGTFLNIYDATADTERLRIDSSGKVGIGESTPTRKLHVAEDANNDVATFINSDSTNGYGVNIRAGGTASGRYALRVANDSNTVVLQANADGNVGIGASSPDSLLELSSSSSGYIPTLKIANTNPSRWGGQLVFESTSSGTSYDAVVIKGDGDQAVNSGKMIVEVAGSERMRIDSSGRVGVGTTNTNHAFVLEGQDQALMIRQSNGNLGNLSNNTSQKIWFQGGNAEIGLFRDSGGNYEYVVGTYQGVFPIPLVFRTGNRAERMRIDSSGRLLLGTTTEGYVSADDLTIASTGSTGMTIRSGTSSYGSIFFSDAVSGSGEYAGAFEYNHAANSLGFYTNSAQRMLIDSSGNVGIGTTSPTHELTVHNASNTAGTIEANRFSVRDNYGNVSGLGNGFVSPAANTLAFATNSTERMRIDSSGRLLVGASSGSGNAKLQVQGGTQFGDAYIDLCFNGNIASGQTLGELRFTDAASSANVYANIACQADAAPGSGDYPGRLVFRTTADSASSPTERMRISSGGSVSIGSSSTSAKLSVTSDGSTLASLILFESAAGSGSVNTAAFYRNSTSSFVGSIATTGTATAYNTSSDYRLKENVVDIADGITRVKQLQPKRFNFIADADTTVDGFLAHEAQTVVPEAVTGEKDGEAMQGIDQSKLVPLLTAALQEAIAKIETLEQRLSDAGIA